jgi:hypothetical protein
VVAVTVNQLPSATATSTNASCSNCPDGAVNAIATGGTGPYTYTWNPGATASAYVFGLVPGCYTVNVVDANLCATTQTACVSFATGMTSNAISEDVRIYPNPAQTNVMIQYSGTEFSYSIYNTTGQLIAEKHANKDVTSVQVSEYAKGIYMLVIQTGTTKIMKKLIIE